MFCPDRRDRTSIIIRGVQTKSRQAESLGSCFLSMSLNTISASSIPVKLPDGVYDGLPVLAGKAEV